MNWLPLLIALGVSVLAGAWVGARLRARNPAWNVRRRVLTAAVPLPALILLATLVGIVWYRTGSEADMRDLAVAAITGIGLIFGAVCLAGALVGAVMAERDRP